MFEEFLNKRVVVIKKGGYKKFGTLKQTTFLGIFLEFIDGSIHFISNDSIEDLSEDKIKWDNV
jgi:hypothetical protein